MPFEVLEQAELEEFGFQAKPPVQLFENNQPSNLQGQFFNLLVVSIKHKFIIAIYNNELKVVPASKLNDLITKSDLSDEKHEYLELSNSDTKTVKFDHSTYGDITQIWLNGSESALFFVYNEKSFGYIDVTTLLNSSTNEINLIRSFDSSIINVIPNPYNNSQIALILKNETCHILDVINKEPPKEVTNATALCWLNASGGFVVAESENLDLIIDNNNDKKSIQLKDKLPLKLKPYHLKQINDDSILVVFADSLELEPVDGYNCLALVVNLTNFRIEEAEDIGTLYDYILRIPFYYTSSLKFWCKDYPDLLISGTSKTTDISILTSIKTISQLNDSDRASMPLDDASGDDDTIMGLSIDVLNTDNVLAPCPNLESSGPLPRLAVLSNRGQLLLWNIWYTIGIKHGDCKLQTVVESELKRIDAAKSSAPIKATSTPVSSAPSQVYAAPPVTHSNVTTDTPVGSSTSGPAFGQTGFGSKNQQQQYQLQRSAFSLTSGSTNSGFSAFANQKSAFSSLTGSAATKSIFDDSAAKQTKDIFGQSPSTFGKSGNSNSLFSSIIPDKPNAPTGFSFNSFKSTQPSNTFAQSSFGTKPAEPGVFGQSSFGFSGTNTASADNPFASLSSNKSAFSNDSPYSLINKSSSEPPKDSPFTALNKSSLDSSKTNPFESLNKTFSATPKFGFATDNTSNENKSPAFSFPASKLSEEKPENNLLDSIGESSSETPAFSFGPEKKDNQSSQFSFISGKTSSTSAQDTSFSKTEVETKKQEAKLSFIDPRPSSGDPSFGFGQPAPTSALVGSGATIESNAFSNPKAEENKSKPLTSFSFDGKSAKLSLPAADKNNSKPGFNFDGFGVALDEESGRNEELQDDKEDFEDDEDEESTCEEDEFVHEPTPSAIPPTIRKQEVSVEPAMENQELYEIPDKSSPTGLVEEKVVVETIPKLQPNNEARPLSDDELEQQQVNTTNTKEAKEKHDSPTSSFGDDESFEKIDSPNSKASTSEEFEKVEAVKSISPHEEQPNAIPEDSKVTFSDKSQKPLVAPVELSSDITEEKNSHPESLEDTVPESIVSKETQEIAESTEEGETFEIKVVTKSSETRPLKSKAIDTESLLIGKSADAELKEYKTSATGIGDEYKDFAVESFEDDEVYLSKLKCPKAVPNLISLGTIEYPEFTGGPIANEMHKIIIDVDAEFHVISQNLMDTREFLMSHQDNELMHTIKSSVSFPTFWRLNEAGTIADDIKETQTEYDGIHSKLDSNLKDSEEVLEKLSLQFKKLYEFRTQLNLINSKEKTKSAIQDKELSFDQIQVRNGLRRSLVNLKNLEKDLQAKLLLLNSTVQPSELLDNPRKFDVIITNLNLKMRIELDNLKKLQTELSDIKENENVLGSGKVDIGLKLDKASEAVRITSMASSIATKRVLSQALRGRMLVPSQFSS